MPADDVTALLIDWRRGNDGAVEKHVPLVHDDLRLIDIRRVQWQDRAHFFAMAAGLMRRVVVDFARPRGNQKRGGGLQRATFDQKSPVPAETPDDLIAIDDALRALTAQYERKVRS